MENRDLSRIKTAVAICLLTCLVCLFFVYQGFSSSRRVVADNAKVMQELRDKVDECQSKIVKLEEAAAAANRQRQYANAGGSTTLETGDESRKSMSSTAAGAKRDENLDPQALREVIDEQREKKQVMSYVDGLKEKKANAYRADVEKYGSRFVSLYEAASLKPGRGRDSRDSDLAYEHLVQEYPDAYGTAVATAERALESALDGKVSSVESYYNTLTAANRSEPVVTENGIDAMPSIRSYLASDYIQKGNFEEADAVIRSMETENADSYVATPGQNGSPNWESAATVAQTLRKNLEAASSGQQGR